MTDRDDTRSVERLLKASRPRVPDEFVSSVEERLFTNRSVRAARPRIQLAFAAMATVTALIAIAAILALAGTGPFASDDDAARAQPDCRWVDVSKPGRIPVVEETASGARIVYRNGTVRTRERVCR